MGLGFRVFKNCSKISYARVLILSILLYRVFSIACFAVLAVDRAS